MTHYILYIDNKPVFECDEWYIAHGLETGVYGIEEYTGLMIYTSINNVPKWGNTPNEQTPALCKCLKRMRTRYLKQITTSDQERIETAKLKFDTLVAKLQEKCAAIDKRG